MGNGLGIGSHLIVLLIAQVDVSRLETGESVLDKPDLGLRSTMMNDNLHCGLA